MSWNERLAARLEQVANNMAEVSEDLQRRCPPKVHKAIVCPKCGSDQVAPVGKHISVTRGLIGVGLVGPVGLLAASTNKIQFVCSHCGKKWNH